MQADGGLTGLVAALWIQPHTSDMSPQSWPMAMPICRARHQGEVAKPLMSTLDTHLDSELRGPYPRAEGGSVLSSPPSDGWCMVVCEPLLLLKYRPLGKLPRQRALPCAQACRVDTKS